MKLTIEVNGPSEAEVAIETLTAFRNASSAAKPDTATTKAKTTPAKEKPAPKAKTTPAKEKAKPVEKDESSENSDEITLKDLTAIAKEAVSRTDRETAKEVIAKYGAKLSAVDEDDYAKLAEDLKAL